jgi:LuxR family transcriptional regulator of csgAB operon
MNIKLICPERLNHSNNESHFGSVDIIVIDQSTLTPNQVDRYHKTKVKLGNDAKEVIINARAGLEHRELLKWQHLVGVFYVNDDMDKLIKGFRCVLAGEMWMSRALLNDYITFYRSRFRSSTSSTFDTLTKRERQIIMMLSDGASNVEIAEALFVSENTVKAHLHNTFKKLNVTNRVQALIWAKDNIAAKEYAEY